MICIGRKLLGGALMSSYNIEHLLKSFASRTMKNLEFIEKNYSDEGLYEITQLINSLLGLIVLPYEANKNDCKNNDSLLKEAAPDAYYSIRDLIVKCNDEKRLYDSYNSTTEVGHFIMHIRNAISHSGDDGILFSPVLEQEQITDVYFYDRFYDRQQRVLKEFCVKISVGELRDLVRNIYDLFCRFENKDNNASEKQEEYKKRIDKKDNLLKNSSAN